MINHVPAIPSSLCWLLQVGAATRKKSHHAEETSGNYWEWWRWRTGRNGRPMSLYGRRNHPAPVPKRTPEKPRLSLATPNKFSMVGNYAREEDQMRRYIRHNQISPWVCCPMRRTIGLVKRMYLVMETDKDLGTISRHLSTSGQRIAIRNNLNGGNNWLGKISALSCESWDSWHTKVTQMKKTRNWSAGCWNCWS